MNTTRATLRRLQAAAERHEAEVVTEAAAIEDVLVDVLSVLGLDPDSPELERMLNAVLAELAAHAGTKDAEAVRQAVRRAVGGGGRLIAMFYDVPGCPVAVAHFQDEHNGQFTNRYMPCPNVELVLRAYAGDAHSGYGTLDPWCLGMEPRPDWAGVAPSDGEQP